MMCEQRHTAPWDAPRPGSRRPSEESNDPNGAMALPGTDHDEADR